MLVEKGIGKDGRRKEERRESFGRFIQRLAGTRGGGTHTMDIDPGTDHHGISTFRVQSVAGPEEGEPS